MAKTVTTERTTAGLCDALFEELDLLRNGKSDAHRASAVSKMAVQIINTKRLEIDAASYLKAGLNIRSIALRAQGLSLGVHDGH